MPSKMFHVFSVVLARLGLKNPKNFFKLRDLHTWQACIDMKKLTNKKRGEAMKNKDIFHRIHCLSLQFPLVPVIALSFAFIALLLTTIIPIERSYTQKIIENLLIFLFSLSIKALEHHSNLLAELKIFFIVRKK